MPNNFLINIRPEERATLHEFLQSHGLGQPQMFPMVRARITAINSRPSESLKFKGDSGRGFLEREQNLTWSADLMDDNQLIAGHWWTPADSGKPLVSISSEYQEALQLKLGDKLSFDIAGEAVDRGGCQHPQDTLGQLPAEFLSGVSAGTARRRRRHLHDQRII